MGPTKLYFYIRMHKFKVFLGGRESIYMSTGCIKPYNKILSIGLITYDIIINEEPLKIPHLYV